MDERHPDSDGLGVRETCPGLKKKRLLLLDVEA